MLEGSMPFRHQKRGIGKSFPNISTRAGTFWSWKFHCSMMGSIVIFSQNVIRFLKLDQVSYPAESIHANIPIHKRIFRKIGFQTREVEREKSFLSRLRV